MKRVVLPNGLTVIFERKLGKAVVVEVMVKVGSNDENSNEAGLSHFMEHILFEGTEKRPTNWVISNEIERIGGDFNAYTTYERTCFYIKVLKKHFPKAVEVLADILQNPLFKEKEIRKEKKIILKEIDMVYDEPRFYQWLLFQKSLFKNHPCRNPTYGNKKVIQSLERNKLKNYYERYYVPNNMVVSIVGDVKNWKEIVSNYFSKRGGKKVRRREVYEPLLSAPLTRKEKRNFTNNYTLLGYKTVPRTHPDYFVLEIVNAILGRGQSGKMFTEIRSKKGLAYDVGTQNVAERSFGYFAVYASVDKNNITIVRDLILQEINKLKEVTGKDLAEAKTYLEGDYLLELEDAQKLADQLLICEQNRGLSKMKNYLNRIKKVSLLNIKRVVNNYFKNYLFVVIEGK